MKCLVSCVTYEPKLRPTMQCHVGLYFLSNSCNAKKKQKSRSSEQRESAAYEACVCVRVCVCVCVRV